ncbi:MAG: T9SS type A sorting domain-containing protein [Crocinitomicaceae bacterium]
MIQKTAILFFIIFSGYSSFTQERFNTHIQLSGAQTSNFIDFNSQTYTTYIGSHVSGNKRFVIKYDLNESGNFLDSVHLQMDEPMGVQARLLHNSIYLLGVRDSSSQITSNEKVYIAKYNTNLDTVWTLLLDDFPDQAVPASLIYIGGDSLILAGHYKEQPSQKYKQFLSLLDTNGTEIWRQLYNMGTNDQIAYSVETTDDGGYLVSGGTKSWGNGGFDWYLMKVDPNGVFQWHKWWGSPTGESCFCKRLEDGNYVLFSGIDNQWGHFSSYAMKVDPNGDTIWTSNLELRDFGSDGLANVAELENGDLFFVGSGVDTNNLRTQGQAVKVNANGEFQWRRIYELGPQSNYLEGVTKTPDGGFAMVGYANPPVGDQDVWIVKVDSMGCDVPLCYLGERELGLELPILKCYPNPASSISTIELLENSREIQLYNSAGMLQKKLEIENNEKELKLDLSLFPHDIYILRLLDKNGVTIGQGKVVKR